MLILARQQRYTRGMVFYEVAPTKIVRAGVNVFTYASEDKDLVGHVVRIPIGKSSGFGLVIRVVDKPSFATKPIESVVTERALPLHLVSTALWMAEYYHTPLATVLQTMLPRGIDKKRRVRPDKKPVISARSNRTTIVLNNDQASVVETILAQKPQTTLLQGVTGSGKTEVYKAVIKAQLAAGKSAIVLVPEISLTSQLVADLQADFPDILLTHSHMTEAARHAVWHEALISTQPRVAVGPRSALFLPLHHLGTIVVDEAHEPSYKQEQAPRYSAQRAAGVMGAAAKATVILGSATPLVTDRYLAESTGRSILRLDAPARQQRKAPSVSLVDMTKREHFRQHRFLSDALIDSITIAIEKNQQALVFHNRRGSAATTLCEVCGWTAECPTCFLPLTLHADRFQLSCHVCAYTQKVPTSCPVCHSSNIIHKGIGTKLIESELRKLFPKARISRFDSDNAKDATVSHLYEELYSGAIDIAIGTQVVAKGLDLPKLHSVGVIQADSGLSLPDFAASERTFQLLAQVVGRVGRDDRDTQVVVQSYQPTHPSVALGIAQDYDAFYEITLQQRQQAGFPPYTHLLRLTTSYKSEQAAVNAARKLAAVLKHDMPSSVRLLGPTPAFYERQHDTYRWQLLLKSPVRADLIRLLDQVPPTHWMSELDPVSLL